MAEAVTTDKTTDKRLRNLRPPWPKGFAPNPSGKRKDGTSAKPRKIDWLAAFREHMAQGTRYQTLCNTLRKKKPETAMAYLAGKPADTVLIGGAVDAPPVKIEEVEAAAAVARKNRGVA